MYTALVLFQLKCFCLLLCLSIALIQCLDHLVNNRLQSLDWVTRLCEQKWALSIFFLWMQVRFSAQPWDIDKVCNLASTWYEMGNIFIKQADFEAATIQDDTKWNNIKKKLYRFSFSYISSWKDFCLNNLTEHRLLSYYGHILLANSMYFRIAQVSVRM